MERQFTKEIESLRLGDGEVFHGEGILAVTKALLQSGISYVGGYQGAPVSHVMDVLNDARDIMDELGIHIETNASEAGAAAPPLPPATAQPQAELVPRPPMPLR